MSWRGKPRRLTLPQPSDTVIRLSGTGFTAQNNAIFFDSLLANAWEPPFSVHLLSKTAMEPFESGTKVTTQTRFLQDILRQPAAIKSAINHLIGPGNDALCRARFLIQSSNRVIITGIGASWHAALTASSLFYLQSHPIYALEAGELLHFAVIPPGSVIIAISRTGSSVEIVRLLDKAKSSGASLIGITNCADSPLAKESDVTIVVPTQLDHGISVVTYSTLSLAASALPGAGQASFESVANCLLQTVGEAAERLQSWQRQMDQSSWLSTEQPYYFLARGPSLGTCHEARLLWEEGVKVPATAMSTGGFRHGPLEIVRPGMRFCLWMDQSQMREQDLAVASDLKELGAAVMLIGEGLPHDAAADIVCELPASPRYWQFLIDIWPIQLAAERLSRLSGADPDSFRFCPYVVEDEYGLLQKHAQVTPDAK